MIDIKFNEAKKDFELFDTLLFKGKNILDTQLGDLYYLKDLGIDKDYFFSTNVLFQNDSFTSYVIERLLQEGITSNMISNLLEDFVKKIKILLGGENGRN